MKYDNNRNHQSESKREVKTWKLTLNFPNKKAFGV